MRAVAEVAELLLGALPQPSASAYGGHRRWQGIGQYTVLVSFLPVPEPPLWMPECS